MGTTNDTWDRSHAALVERREKIVAEMRQMQIDIDHWNSIHPNEEPLGIEPWPAAIEEMLRDRPAVDGKVAILVDGRLCDVADGGTLSYAAVVRLAGYDPARILSVKHVHGPEGGILSPGRSVRVAAGMRFTVADTSNA